jgi:hypothetical protein
MAVTACIAGINLSSNLTLQNNFGLTSNNCYPTSNDYFEFDFYVPIKVNRYTFTNSTNGGGLAIETWNYDITNGLGANLSDNFLSTINDKGTTYATTSVLSSASVSVHMFGWFYAHRTGSFTFTVSTNSGYANIWVNTQSSLLSLSSPSSKTVSMTAGTYYYLRVFGWSSPSLTVTATGPGLPLTTDLTGWVFPGKLNNMYASDAPKSWSIQGDPLGFNSFISLGSVTGNANTLPGASYTYTIANPQPVTKLRFYFASTIASNILSIPQIEPFTAAGSIIGRYNPAVGFNQPFGGLYTGTTNMTSGSTTYYGEWLQISFPAVSTVSEYFFQMDNPPVSWALHKSTDGSTWSVVELVSNIFISTPEVHRIITPTSGQHWRIQILETSNYSTIQGNFIVQSFGLMDSFGHVVHTVQPNNNSYTAGYETVGDAVIGTYTINSSTGDFTQPLQGVSATFSSSYSPSGVYTGATVTSNIINLPPVYGEWVQLGMPSPRLVSNIVFQSQDVRATPSNVWILASNDSISWNIANISTLIAGHYPGKSFVLNSILPGPFKYWRMIVANTSPDYTGSGFNLSNWYMLGSNGQVLNNQLYGMNPALGGLYNGTTSTTITTPASTIYGEWLEFSLPTATISNVLYINSPQPSTLTSIVATNTVGTSFVLLSNVNLYTGGFVTFPNSTAYKYYRLIFTAAYNTSVGISSIYFCNSKGAPLSQLLTGSTTTFPTNSVFGTGVIGQYTFSSSKTTNDDAYIAFNHMMTPWVYDTSAGSAYIQIEFNTPVVASEVWLYRPMFNQFNIVGTNDYITFTTILTSKTVNPAIDGQPQIFSYPIGSPGAYRVYRLNITQSLYGSTTVSIDDIAFYDSQGRINEPCMSNRSLVLTSSLFGGNAFPNSDILAVSFPTATTVGSYSFTSQFVPRAWVVYGNNTNPVVAGATALQTVYSYIYNNPTNTFVITTPGAYRYYIFQFTSMQSNPTYSSVYLANLKMYSPNGFQLLPQSFTDISTTPTYGTQSSECLGTYVANASIYNSQVAGAFGGSPVSFNSPAVPPSYSTGWFVKYWNRYTNIGSDLQALYATYPISVSSNILHLQDLYKTPLGNYLNSTGTLIFETNFNFTATGVWTFNIPGYIWIGTDATSPTWYNNPSSTTYTVSVIGTKLIRMMITWTGVLYSPTFQVTSPSGVVSNQIGPHVTSGTAGEWIEVKLPGAASIDYYFLDSTASNWTMYGSNDYQNWITLNSNAANVSNIYGTTNKTPCQVVRIVATNATSITFNNIKLFSNTGRINSIQCQGNQNTFFGGAYNSLNSGVNSVANGEFLEFSLPASTAISGYVLSTNAVNWQVHYSTNYTAWTLLDSQVNQYVPKQYYSASATAKFFRVSSNLIPETATFSVSSFYTVNNYGQQVVPILTTNTTQIYDSYYLGYLCGKQLTSISFSSGIATGSNLGYMNVVYGYNTDGSNTHTTSTVVSGVTTYGEWIQEYYNFNIVPKYYYICSSSSISWTLAGSTDGISWAKLASGTATGPQTPIPVPIPQVPFNSGYSFYLQDVATGNYVGYNGTFFVCSPSYPKVIFTSFNDPTVYGNQNGAVALQSSGGYMRHSNYLCSPATFQAYDVSFGWLFQQVGTGIYTIYNYFGVPYESYWLDFNSTNTLSISYNQRQWRVVSVGSLNTGVPTSVTMPDYSAHSNSYIRLIVTNATVSSIVKSTLTDLGSNVFSYSSGNFGGYFSATPLITTGTVVGEWIQLQYQGPVSANSMYFSNSSNCGYTLLGSQDGSTWTSIVSNNPVVTPYG